MNDNEPASIQQIIDSAIKETLASGVKPKKMDSNVSKVLVTIPLFCSDSRNTTVAYYKAKKQVIHELNAQGIKISFKKLNDPGAFMSPTNIAEIVRLIVRASIKYSEYIKNDVPVECDVHDVGHSHSRRLSSLREARRAAVSPDQLVLMEHCTNCGMQHLSHAVERMQEIILNAKPTFTVAGKRMPIRTGGDLMEYMKMHFKDFGIPTNWDGDLLTWLEPIGDLKDHPVKQIKLFEATVEKNAAFQQATKGMTIKTFADILNYTNIGFHTIGGSGKKDLVLDQIYRKIRANGPTPDHDKMVAKQRNPVLVIGSPGVSHSRKLVAKELGIQPSAGEVFSIINGSGKGPLGPHSLIGFAYALDLLNDDKNPKLVMLGKNDADLRRIKTKVRKDRLARTIVRACVTKPENIMGMVDPRKSFPDMNPNAVHGQQKRRIMNIG